MDELSAKGRVETLIRSLSRFSERAMLIITSKSDVRLEAKKIGPALIFERLWKPTGSGSKPSHRLFSALHQGSH